MSEQRVPQADEVDAALGHFVDRVCSAVPGCQGAAISVLTDGAPEILAHRQVADSLAVQLCTPAGPLYEALSYGEPRRISSLSADHRWPAFGSAAMHAGYRSCLFLPLADSASIPAAVSLLATKPHAFDSTPYDVASLFDDLELVEHVQTALGTRAVIRRAQRILMHRHNIAADHALDVLERCSQHADVDLGTVSLGFVDTWQCAEEF